MTITWREAIQLWEEQENKIRAWRQNLIKEAENIRNSIEEKLNAPQDKTEIRCKDKHYNRRYVEIVDIVYQDIGINIEQAFTSSGELRFYISILLEKGTNTHPKQAFNLPIALRFENKAIQYALWYTENDTPDKWYDNKDEFINIALNQFRKHLEFDPIEGFDKKEKIGFLAN